MTEQRGVVHFLWAKNMEAKDMHKEMLPIVLLSSGDSFPHLIV
jgi:hypothetical protein